MKNKRRFLSLLLWAFAAVLPAQVRAVTPPAIYNLGTLGGPESDGYAINASGQVAGAAFTAGSGGGSGATLHAFRYSGTPGSGGAMVDLGTIGGSVSWGYAINASGQIAGDSYTSMGATHAFRYSSIPGMVDLGTL